jgi:hypothetical protein
MLGVERRRGARREAAEGLSAYPFREPYRYPPHQTPWEYSRMTTRRSARLYVLFITAALMTVPTQGYGNLIGVGLGLYLLEKFRAHPP